MTDMSTSKGIGFLPQSQTKNNKKEMCYLCGADTDTKGGININGELKPVCFGCLCGLANRN